METTAVPLADLATAFPGPSGTRSVGAMPWCRVALCLWQWASVGWETGGRRLHGQSSGCHPLLWGWQGHFEKVWAPLFCCRENCRRPPLAAPSEVNCLTICLVQRFPSVPPRRIWQPLLRPAPAAAAPETRACVPSSTLCSPNPNAFFLPYLGTIGSAETLAHRSSFYCWAPRASLFSLPQVPF